MFSTKLSQIAANLSKQFRKFGYFCLERLQEERSLLTGSGMVL